MGGELCVYLVGVWYFVARQWHGQSLSGIECRRRQFNSVAYACHIFRRELQERWRFHRICEGTYSHRSYLAYKQNDSHPIQRNPNTV